MNAIPMLLQCRKHQFPFSRWSEIQAHGDWLRTHRLISQPEEMGASIHIPPGPTVAVEPVYSPVELWAGEIGLSLPEEEMVGW